jgi:hypothetical protein
LIGHISTDELAGYRAGAVSASRAARISAHLAGCVRCAGIDSRLAGVSALLASVPAPPMPDHLNERMLATLAAEAARRTAASPAPATDQVAAGAAGRRAPWPVPERPHAPRRAGGRSWRPRRPDWSSALLLRGLAITGGLVVLVGGGLVLADLGASVSSGTAARSTGGLAATAPTTPGSLHLPAGGTSVGAASNTPVNYSSDGHEAQANIAVSDASYTRSDLAAGVRKEITSSPELSPLGVSSGSAGPAPAPGQGPSSAPRKIGGMVVSQLAGCLSRVTAGHQVMLAEVARYLRAPVTIIVLKPIGGVFDVIVVGAACSATDADVITRLSVPSR